MQHINSLLQIHDIDQTKGVLIVAFAQFEYAGPELWKRFHVKWRFCVLQLPQSIAEGGFDRCWESGYIVLAAAYPHNRSGEQQRVALSCARRTGSARRGIVLSSHPLIW